MKVFLLRLMWLMLGIFLYSAGIVFMVNAGIGYAPWDVFHAGISKSFGISFGLASIYVGLVIVVLVALVGEKMGIGTIFNMAFIGLIVDLLMYLSIIPEATSMPISILMLTAGMFIISFGSYYYINSAFGAGPRDSLMAALTRITKLPVGLCRSAIELSAAASGWLLGGMVGVGTVISVIGIGFCIQIIFRLYRFDPSMVKHETLGQTGKTFISIFKTLHVMLKYKIYKRGG